jgi:hypothetical protein
MRGVATFAKDFSGLLLEKSIKTKRQPMPATAPIRPAYRVRGGPSLRLPTEPRVRIRTRLLMQDISIEKHQTNALAFNWSVFSALLG